MRTLFSSAFVFATLFAAPVIAQAVQVTPLDDLLQELSGADALGLGAEPREAATIDVIAGSGAELRVLDKLTGAVSDLSLKQGEIAQLASLSVALVACRYPVDNPAGDAFAFVEVIDRREDVILFSGWMLGSAPALNAMDHPRYDVWALRCITS
jgi:hypothetical protein